MKNPIIYRILQQGFCLIFCLGLLSSCIREEEFVNNPQGNFEQLWKIIDEQYCFLDYKQIDWDEIHTRYQKLITPNMGSEGLFEVLSEMLYEYTSSAANNGSGFEGLADNTPFWNISTGIALIMGRYFPIVGQVAIAGLLASKKCIPESAGTLRTDTGTFSLMTFAVIIIVAALSFFPAQALGPIADYLSF